MTLRGGKVVEKHILDHRKIGKESISESKKESNEPLIYEEITNSPPKDLCTIKKRNIRCKRKIFSRAVSSIFLTNNAIKFKDPDCPTISYIIGTIKLNMLYLISVLVLICFHTQYIDNSILVS